ncbi:MAG: imelysin family protein [Pseudomonadota bacterium]
MILAKPTMATIAAAVWLLHAPIANAQQAFSDTRIQTSVQRTIIEYIRPAFTDFQDQATRTRDRISNLCNAPDQLALNQVRHEFAELVPAWSKIEILRFGPLVKDNRFERLHFWPDRRGRALKQVQAALAANDPSVTNAQSLSGKSVAVQGLGALEYLLYGTGSEALTTKNIEGQHRCIFARAVASNVTNIGRELRTDWADEDGFSAALIRFGPNNARFRNAREVAVQMFGTVVDGLDWVKDAKLKPVIGDTAEKAKPKRASFWRSEQTTRAIAANLDGLRTYLLAADLLAMLPESERYYAQSVAFEFANANRALSQIEKAPLEAFTNEADRGKLTYTIIVVDSLRDIMAGVVGPALGVQSGFSVLDGD